MDNLAGLRSILEQPALAEPPPGGAWCALACRCSATSTTSSAWRGPYSETPEAEACCGN